jgi:hypothetical protein
MLRPTVKHPFGAYNQLFITVRQLLIFWCGALSLTRERVCCLQFLLILASAVILWSKSQGARDHILLSKIRDSPNLEGQVPVFISPRNRVAQLYPQALGSLFVTSYDSQGYGGGIRTLIHAGVESLISSSQSQSYITTDCQSANLSWNKSHSNELSDCTISWDSWVTEWRLGASQEWLSSIELVMVIYIFRTRNNAIGIYVSWVELEIPCFVNYSEIGEVRSCKSSGSAWKAMTWFLNWTLRITSTSTGVLSCCNDNEIRRNQNNLKAQLISLSLGFLRKIGVLRHVFWNNGRKLILSFSPPTGETNTGIGISFPTVYEKPNGLAEQVRSKRYAIFTDVRGIWRRIVC